MNKLLNTAELANYLNVNPVTVRRKAMTGELPATKVGKHYRFDKEKIDIWLSEKTIGRLTSILVIDDEPLVLSFFEHCLSENRYHLSTASNGHDAMKMIDEMSFDLIFLDLILPMINGAELFGYIRNKNANVPVIIITGYADSELLNSAMKYGPFLIMKKPFSKEDILKVVGDLADRDIG